ncbi:hypothetical protein EDB86DRAFT_2829129 [Lactarius hatsudake]|nr:hypothetical protein EDB86DRAFT_2829129 [Lactarius hatsudake]
MTCAAGGNTKRSCHFSNLCPRELWALGSLDPHRRGKSQSKESVLVNDRAVDSRSMGEEAVPLENGEIRAKGADEWQNLRTLLLSKRRREYLPWVVVTHFLLLTLLHPALITIVMMLGGGAPQFVEAGKNVPRKAAPKLVIAASREPRRAASARTFRSGTEQLRKDVGGEVKKRLQASMSRPIRNEIVIAANVEENGEEFEAGQRSRGTLGKTRSPKNCGACEDADAIVPGDFYVTGEHDSEESDRTHLYSRCGRNATISGELTLGYATSKGDNEHGERCGWVKCVVLFGEWNKCVLDTSARWGVPTRVGKDWGTSLQTALRGQRLKMGSQYRECVNDEGTPSVLIKGPPESRRGIDKGNDDVDGEGEWARGSEKRRVIKPYRNVDSLRYIDVWLYAADEVTETMGESPGHVSSRAVDFHPEYSSTNSRSSERRRAIIARGKRTVMSSGSFANSLGEMTGCICAAHTCGESTRAARKSVAASWV